MGGYCKLCNKIFSDLIEHTSTDEHRQLIDCVVVSCVSNQRVSSYRKHLDQEIQPKRDEICPKCNIKMIAVGSYDNLYTCGHSFPYCDCETTFRDYNCPNCKYMFSVVEGNVDMMKEVVQHVGNFFCIKLYILK